MPRADTGFSRFIVKYQSVNSETRTIRLKNVHCEANQVLASQLGCEPHPAFLRAQRSDWRYKTLRCLLTSLQGPSDRLVTRSATNYNELEMIKSFRHKGLQRFFETGSKAGIQAAHAARLRLQLAALDQAVKPDDLSAPAWGLHPLKGDLKGHWAITVNGNWRMVFTFDGTDAVLVDYRDYH
jgi:toxin HigB-1